MIFTRGIIRLCKAFHETKDGVKLLPNFLDHFQGGTAHTTLHAMTTSLCFL
ncbi:hypothetical protein HanIR_Chr04g0197901 [Helianthus annuus]|nr:hypothetical protein HanIR_Chr04g0197901 [Helianthus annuus]